MKYCVAIMLIGLLIEIVGFGMAVITNHFTETMWITNIGVITGLSGAAAWLVVFIVNLFIKENPQSETGEV